MGIHAGVKKSLFSSGETRPASCIGGAMEHRHESEIKIACVQMEPMVGHKARNVSRTLEFIAQAANAGARLIVLPELATLWARISRTGTRNSSQLCEPVPTGPTCEAWRHAAAEHRIYLVSGIAERDGACLYNSAVVIGPEGYIGKFGVHLWNEENLFFEPGNQGFPYFKLLSAASVRSFARTAGFPRATGCARCKVRISFASRPSWVPIPGQDPKREAMANISYAWLRRTPIPYLWPRRTEWASSGASLSTDKASS